MLGAPLPCTCPCCSNRVQGKARYLSMVAGGSGITPCWDVAREVLQDPTDNTRISLVYANKHEEDIWLREVRGEKPGDRSVGLCLPAC